MKTLLLPILTIGLLASSPVFSQEMTINLTGDANTEQSSKLELIRILQERLNKLTVGQMNSRILVSSGVKSYYKVGEIVQMHKDMWGLRSKYTTLAGNLEKGNQGFNATNGNGFSWKYMQQYNNSMSKAEDLKNQLLLLLKDGKPIALPALPTFNISAPASSATYSKDYMDSMNGIIAKYGIKQPGDENNLPADQKAAFDAEVKAANEKFSEAFSAAVKQTNTNSLKIIGNVVGAFFGIPGAGNLVAGLISGGGAAALAGLVGNIVDKFQIPDEYFDSETLKLTDAERLKVIDELHLRMSELYQQTVAYATNMSSEAKVRYNEISQPRNDMILYGPKK